MEVQLKTVTVLYGVRLLLKHKSGLLVISTCGFIFDSIPRSYFRNAKAIEIAISWLIIMCLGVILVQEVLNIFMLPTSANQVGTLILFKYYPSVTISLLPDLQY